MTDGEDSGDVVSPSTRIAATVGAPLIIFGVGLGAGTIRSDDWVVPVLASGAIILAGGIRSLIWARRARDLTICLDSRTVKITRGSRVLIDAPAADIQAAEFVRSTGSILFSPNHDIPTLVLWLAGRSVDVELWMPYEPQIERLERLWREHGLPG